MLYYLFEYLTGLGVPGSRLMSYITFRSGMALMLSLLIAIFIGKKIIAKLQSMQVGEIIRDLDLEGQMNKKGTPTMGGIIIIVSILIPCILLGAPFMQVLDITVFRLAFSQDTHHLVMHTDIHIYRADNRR